MNQFYLDIMELAGAEKWEAHNCIGDPVEIYNRGRIVVWGIDERKRKILQRLVDSQVSAIFKITVEIGK